MTQLISVLLSFILIMYVFILLYIISFVMLYAICICYVYVFMQIRKKTERVFITRIFIIFSLAYNFFSL